MDLDTTGWSGDGDFTKLLIDALQGLPIRLLKVEDAPASRSDTGFSFVSNELFVVFEGERMTLASLHEVLSAMANVGEADYADDGMLQYLRAERIIPPYQTRGYKLIELVRIYEAGKRT